MPTHEVELIRRLIDGLRRDRRTHPYQGRREYSQLAREVIAQCEDLLARDSVAVRTLTRRAIERITAALMYMDDSSGIVGDDLHEAMALYARACAAAPPDSKRLAAWLANLVLDGPGWPDVYLRDFAQALGEPGRAEVARIVDERATGPEPDSWTAIGIRILREQLAEIGGDLDDYVAVLAETPHAGQYLKIVTALREAGRLADAEKWAVTGLAVVENPIQLRHLRTAYVDLLLERGASDEALALRQELFDAKPTRQHFTDLKDTAAKAGGWDGLRDQAIQHMRDRAAGQPALAPELVDVLILDDYLDEAWRAAVDYADHIGESQWQRLIALRGHTHPSDVIKPYQRLIEQRLAMSNDNYRYNKAVKMLRSLRDAYLASGQDAAFHAYLDEFKDRHKRKTSFIAKIDRAQL